MNNLEKIRKAKGITQSDLAEKTGCCRMSISRWERGHSINDKKLLLLSAALDVTPNHILGIKENSKGRKTK